MNRLSRTSVRVNVTRLNRILISCRLNEFLLVESIYSNVRVTDRVGGISIKRTIVLLLILSYIIFSKLLLARKIFETSHLARIRYFVPICKFKFHHVICSTSKLPLHRIHDLEIHGVQKENQLRSDHARNEAQRARCIYA